MSPVISILPSRASHGARSERTKGLANRATTRPRFIDGDRPSPKAKSEAEKIVSAFSAAEKTMETRNNSNDLFSIVEKVINHTGFKAESSNPSFSSQYDLIDRLQGITGEMNQKLAVQEALNELPSEKVRPDLR
jgi:hypothetical protein